MRFHVTCRKVERGLALDKEYNVDDCGGMFQFRIILPEITMWDCGIKDVLMGTYMRRTKNEDVAVAEAKRL